MGDFLRKNWFGILGLLVGFLVSHHFYNKSKLERVPVFELSSSSLIADASATKDKLIVLRKDEKPIVNNIWAVGFHFWNAGTQVITADEVLDPLLILLESDGEILEYRITNQSRPKVVKATLEQEGKSTLRLGFSIMEPQDAIAGQIIFEGLDPNLFSMSGAILGVKQISSEAPIQVGIAGITILKMVGVTVGFLLALGIFFLTLGGLESLFRLYVKRPLKAVFLMVVGKSKYREWHPKIAKKTGDYIFLIFIILFLAMVLANVVKTSVESPPIPIFQPTINAPGPTAFIS